MGKFAARSRVVTVGTRFRAGNSLAQPPDSDTEVHLNREQFNLIYFESHLLSSEAEKDFKLIELLRSAQGALSSIAPPHTPWTASMTSFLLTG